MKTKLSFGAPGRRQPATPPSPSGRAAALVSVAVIAWFSLALATLAGEWHGAPAAPGASPAAAATAAPPALTALASVRLI